MKANNRVKRPLMQYHGGKFKIASWIIKHFPPHRTYVEPFGGAASVLLRKPRSYAEVYNDADGEVCNLFRVLRDPAQGRELRRIVALTPYARREFELSYLPDEDPIEQARRTLFRFAAGFSNAAGSGQWSTGFKANVTKSSTVPAVDWARMPIILDQIIQRLRGVIIEGPKSAHEIIEKYDYGNALHYIDPPYVWETRGKWAGKAYRHEMSDDDHRELAGILRQVKGMVVLSGYGCDLYDQELYADWTRVEKETRADAAQKRTEVLWLSPNCMTGRAPLFGVEK